MLDQVLEGVRHLRAAIAFVAVAVAEGCLVSEVFDDVAGGNNL